MLTRKQIEKIALKNRVSLFTQERDYVQAVYLSLLYSKTIGLIFKGGTCLRIAYSSQRYSEDLDFNSNLDEDEAYKTLETAVKELEYFGIRAQIRNKRMARDLYDLWFLLERGVKSDIELINSKLALYDKSYSSEEMSERIVQLEKGWSKDLIPLLSVVVPYDAVAKRVVDGLVLLEKRHGLE